MSAVDWSAPFERLSEGQRFSSQGRTITEADLVGFAALTGDWHPQHTDAHWSAESLFGERVAHGMLVLSYAVGLLPLDPSRVLALRRIGDVVFKRPARLGDTIHVEVIVAQLNRLSEKAGLVGCRWNIRDSHDVLLCRAVVDVLWATSTAARPRPADAYVAELIDFPPGVLPC